MNQYSIVFDAGSSGTRMYIYEWKSEFSGNFITYEIFLNFKFLFVQNLANNGEPVVCLNLIFS